MADPVATLLERTTSVLLTTITAAANVGSGEPIVVQISFDPGATITSISDNAGNTYSLKGSVQNAGAFLATYVVESTTGNAALVTTIVFSSTPYCVVHRSKASSGATYDATALAQGVVAANPQTLNSGSPLEAGELLLCLSGNGGGGDQDYATGNGATLLSAEDDGNSWWTSCVSAINAPSTSAYQFRITNGNNASGLTIIGFKAGGGSPDVTLSLSGQSATGSLGTLLPNRSLAGTGSASTISSGTLLPNRSILPTGTAVIASAGTLSVARTIALLGQAVSSAAGTLGVTIGGDLSVNVTGQSVTVSAGTIVASFTVPVAGASSTSSSGTLSPARSIPISGSAGTVSAGTLAPDRQLPLAGASVTTSTGTISVSIGSNLSLGLSGAEVAALAGTLALGLSKALGGQSSTVSSGTLTLLRDILVSGQSVTSSAGTLATSRVIPLVGQLVNIFTNTIYIPGSASTFTGPRDYVYPVSASGRVRWVDYIPVQFFTPVQRQIGTWDDVGALPVTTIPATTGLREWVDYVPVVIEGSKSNRFDDLGFIRVVEVI